MALVLVMASSAYAMPGDPPVTPTSPADGATLPVSADGIPVSFECPLYRVADDGFFPIYGAAYDWGVSFATAPTLGADGRLANPVSLGPGARSTPEGTCSGAMNAGGAARPQETPGTYYWQVWRICTGCPGYDYEVGPVRTLTLVSTAKPTLKLPAKVYAGYPVIATVSGEGLPNFTAVTIERANGSSWTRVGTDTIAGGTSEVTITLPKGAQKLRASLTVGSQTVSSAEVRKSVTSGGKAKKATAGRYKGKAGNGTRSATFTVKGRTLRAFTASVPMTCPGVTAGQFTTQIGTAKFRTIKLAPDGSFVGARTVSGSSMRVRGKLVGARLSGGRVELSVGNCVGDISYQVKHA